MNFRPQVQIIGLQRSGTRWLYQLVTNNYTVSVNRTGKHHLPGEYTHPTVEATLVIRKRFAHWLTSVERNRVNLYKMRPEMYPGDKLDIRAALDVWENFYAKWYAQDGVVQIEYERLLRDPEATMGAVAGYLRWQRHPAQGGFKVGGPDKLPEWRREMYLER